MRILRNIVGTTRTFIDMPALTKLSNIIKVFPSYAKFEGDIGRILCLDGIESAVLDYMNVQPLLLRDFMLKYGIVKTGSDARRLIDQKSVKFRVHIQDTWEVVTDHFALVRYGSYWFGKQYCEIEMDYLPPTKWMDYKAGYSPRVRDWSHRMWPLSLW